MEHKIFKEEFERLIRDAIRKLPDALKDAFISAQKVNLDEKWNRAHEVILQHIAGASIIAFIPIPFSDAPILVANQMTMIARILYIYDLGGLENMLKGESVSVIIGQLVSNLGKTLAVNILAFIPGIGTLVKALINGGVATLLTSALGEAVNISCYKLYESILNGNENIEEQMKMFGDMVQKYATEYFKEKKKPEDYKKPE